LGKTEIKTIIQVIGETLFLYGLLSWVYGVILAFLHPSWLPYQASHLTPWLRQDTLTILSFFFSIAGFFAWRLMKESK